MTPEQREELRFTYKPENVRVLFVCESPPAGGDFFYAGNSTLFVETASVFRHFFRSRAHGTEFLRFFQILGCFLVDLSVTPVNHLAWRSEQRRRQVQRGEPLLAERLREYHPGLVLVTPKGIRENVARALASATSDSPSMALPFPARSKSNVEAYRAGLRDALALGVALGLLPAPGRR